MGTPRNRVHRQPFLGRSPRAKAEEWARLNAKRDKGVQALYRTQYWRELRAACLLAANYRCVNPACATRASIADHIKPHRGDRALFYDAANLQAMCKACHDRKTGSVDSGFGAAALARRGRSRGGE